MTPHTRHQPGPLPRRRHPRDEATVLADRVLVLDQGRIGLDLTIDHPRPVPRGVRPRRTLRERYGLPRPANQHTAALV
jgi:ABC-type nitrate/sulfonate/bicarbonate transport system ATPase subunit